MAIILTDKQKRMVIRGDTHNLISPFKEWVRERLPQNTETFGELRKLMDEVKKAQGKLQEIEQALNKLALDLEIPI
jgi:hypothetical protein